MRFVAALLILLMLPLATPNDVQAGTVAGPAHVDIGSGSYPDYEHVSPRYLTLGTSQDVRWDNDQHNRRANVTATDGTLWCHLDDDDSGNDVCTVANPYPTVGRHRYLVHQDIVYGWTVSAYLCVSDASDLTITSHSANDPINGTVNFAGTASADIGIDAVEVRLNGGPWHASTGTTTWSVSIDTADLQYGDAVAEFRINFGGCILAPTSLDLFIDNTPVLDLRFTHMRAYDLGSGYHGNRATATYVLKNIGNYPTRANFELQSREPGSSTWSTENVHSVWMSAFSSVSREWENYAVPGSDYRVIVTSTSGSVADLTPLDQVAHWPPAVASGGPPTVEVRANELRPAEHVLAAAGQVAWHWRIGDHGIEDTAGNLWCAEPPSVGGIGRICYRSFDAPGGYAYRATDDATLAGAIRVQGTAPTLSVSSPTDGDTVTGTVSFAGTASSAHGLQYTQTRINGGDWVPAPDAGSWVRTIDTAMQPNGVMTLDVGAVGEDGSLTSQSLAVTVDNPEQEDLYPTVTTVRDGTFIDRRVRVFADITSAGNIDTTADIILQAKQVGEWEEVRRVTRTVEAFDSTTVVLVYRCDTCVGPYDLRVVVDPENTVAETDETNNVAETAGSFFAGVN